ncbi:MAG: tetratricopeptide repeat protein [Alphaproteobacteria bacterium]|nr:tetratricopeptide repeat protein [Alphaproteobacteria bacterium]
MVRALHATSFVLLALVGAAPVQAGIKKDLSSCTAGRDKASARACTRVLKSGRLPKNQRYIAYYNRGWSYRNGGDSKRAIRDFTTALRFNGRFADSYYSRSVAHYDRGEMDKANEDLDRYVKKKDGTWSAYYKRALMLRRMEDFEKALSDLQTAAKLKPKEKKIKVLRALILSDLGDDTDALFVIGPVLSKHKKYAAALHARATIHYRQQRYGEALADVDDAIRARKSFAPLHVLKGQILEETGQADKARASYKTARKYSGLSVESLFAGKFARERLAALSGTKGTQVAGDAKRKTYRKERPGKKRAKDTSSSSTTVASTCRRFIPTANTTIRIACRE